MSIKIHYRTIEGYRVLPPRIQEIKPEPDNRSPTERYLGEVDRLIEDTQARIAPAHADDIASLVFANQAVTGELGTHQSSALITERRALAERQIRDIQRELEELHARRPFRPKYNPGDDGTLTEVERQILDLQKQQRALEMALWRDTQELRAELVTQRREHDLTRRRIRYLSGGWYGGV